MTNKTRKISTSPFKKCLKGHETVYEDQFMYDNQRGRVCRKCMEETKTSRRK